MIKINGQCISTLAEFRSFFDADAMGRIGGRIADDTDIFSDDTKYASVRLLLRALAKDEGPRPTLRRADKKVVLCLPGVGELPLIYNVPSKEGEITRQNARKLLVGEIGAAEVNLEDDYEDIIHTDAGKENHFQGINTDWDMHKGDENNSDSQENRQGEILHLVRLQNKSILGDSKIDIGGHHTYAIPPGATAYLLKCGERFINKMPQFSVSAGYTCQMKYGTDGKVTVKCVDSSGRTTVEKQLKAENLQQVCADRAGGFVALMDGKILPYSREIQPEDIFDMYLPDDERVVMIRIVGHQIVALTDKKRVYSNYAVNADPKRPILWIGQNAEGALNYVYEDSYSFPGDVDIIDSGNGKYIYDKGELKHE